MLWEITKRLGLSPSLGIISDAPTFGYYLDSLCCLFTAATIGPPMTPSPFGFDYAARSEISTRNP